jgi:hypothetical protein
MNSKGIVAATSSRTRTGTGLTLTHSLCLFAPLVIFLAVLGWATWEIRLAKPMAFEMFAGLMVVVLVLAIVDALPPIRRIAQRSSDCSKQLDPFYEMAR